MFHYHAKLEFRDSLYAIFPLLKMHKIEGKVLVAFLYLTKRTRKQTKKTSCAHKTADSKSDSDFSDLECSVGSTWTLSRDIGTQEIVQ